MAGYIPRRFTSPRAVTHPSSNRAQCLLTALFELNMLTTTLRRQLKLYCEVMTLFLNAFVQGKLFEEIAVGLKHAKVVIVCASDEVCVMHHKI